MVRTARALHATLATTFVALVVSGFSVAHAQDVGPVGPGPAEVGDAGVAGQFIEWDRPGTPTLVLHGYGRGLRVFADISEDGAFELALPPIDDATPLGTIPCQTPGGAPVAQLTEVTLLTPLAGFTSPSEADRGLSAIGMAALADAAFAADIGSPGSRRVAWIASRVAQTFEPGTCNNAEPFDIAAGWTPVTITYGPSGGPHHLNPGVPDGLGWYWWAFLEPDAR
jgi:hypothetical protein